MRLAACFGLLLLFGFLLVGCGDSGSPPATASAGGGPPVPGGPPSGPPVPGGEGAPANPGDTPPAAETPPPQDPQPTPSAPGGGQPGGEGTPPGDPSNPNPGNPGDDPNANPDAPPRRPPPPRTYKDQSFAAFRMGNDDAGVKLLNAHFAIMPAAKQELAQKMNWYPELRRPALAPRIGIGIHIAEQPLNFKGDCMPTGSTTLTAAVDKMQQAEAADSAIGRTGRMSKFGRGRHGPTLDYSERAKIDQTANWPGEWQVNHYLGDYGDWFIEALKERMETGEYGPVSQELVKQAARAPAPRRDPNNPDAPPEGQPDYAGGPPDGQPGGGGGPPFPGGGGGGGRMGRGGRGGPGGGPGGGFPGGGRGFGGGFGGGGLPGAGANSGPQTSRWSTKGEGNKDSVNLAPVKQILPNMLWLGKADADERDDLVKRAEALNIDILAIYTLTLKQSRAGDFMNNKALLRLVNMRTGKAVADYSPDSIVNLDVERWRQKDDKGTDPVEREILKMLDAVDKVLKPSPLPEAITGERAKKRIADLVAAKPDEPLPVLVEARYYFAKGLLGQDDYVETAKSLLGEEGFTKLAARAKAPLDE